MPPGYCLRCRGCCRFKDRQGPWQPHLLGSEKELREKTGMVANEAGREPGYRCVSLDTARNECTIYPSRPFECRLYPFVLNRRGDRLFLSVDPNCPYVKEQEGRAEFVAYAGKLASRLQQALAAALRENRHLFQPYPDVRDVAELAL